MYRMIPIRLGVPKPNHRVLLQTHEGHHFIAQCRWTKCEGPWHLEWIDSAGSGIIGAVDPCDAWMELPEFSETPEAQVAALAAKAEVEARR